MSVVLALGEELLFNCSIFSPFNSIYPFVWRLVVRMYEPLDISVCVFGAGLPGLNSHSYLVTVFSESQVASSAKWDGNDQGCYVS